MTHFIAMVRYEGELGDLDNILEMMLAPYDENMEVNPYKKWPDEDSVERMAKHYEVSVDNLEKLVTYMEDWSGYEGGIENGKLYYMTTYNPESKWDWWTLGGRWSGLLKLKKDKEGITGESGSGGNPTGIDAAYAKDIDWKHEEMKDFTWDVVLNKLGWNARVTYGWWGISFDDIETREDWDKYFKGRFLSNLKDNTVIAMIYCHGE